MDKYKVKITLQLQKEGGKINGRVKLSLITELPFIPFEGMIWKDEKKEIDFEVKSVTWNGDKGRFEVNNVRRDLSTDDIDMIVDRSLKSGWKRD